MPESVPSRDTMLSLYRTMVRIRRFEEKVAELYLTGALPGFLHTSVGQEAASVGVCAHLRSDDYIVTTHRGHSDVLAKGARTDRMMAELFAKVTGYCRGKGGSMHVADFSTGILGAFAIVGANIPIGTGAAFASWYLQRGQVAVCFFSDGASNQGAFHEGINLGAAWNLPVVYVCHNNRYAHSVPQWHHQKITDIAVRATAYGIPGVTVDGTDVLAVYAAADEAVDRARQGGGPTLIECKLHRLVGHYIGDTPPYRSKEEEDAGWQDDPVAKFRNYLLTHETALRDEIETIEAEIAQEIEAAVEFARHSAAPGPEDAFAHVFAE